MHFLVELEKIDLLILLYEVLAFMKSLNGNDSKCFGKSILPLKMMLNFLSPGNASLPPRILG
jgi:hypothetical protein